MVMHDFGKQSGGDTFVIEGFTNWNKKERLSSHVGGPNSAHNIAWRKCQDLMNQNQHIEVVISKQSEQVRDLYRRRLTASIDCICFLLKQGLAFCGHDESTNSTNQETTNAIITDLRDELFAIIVDEARDISNKEQMAIALRYVNKKGSIVERFFGMVHVKDITALSLKMAIDELFCKHGLNISRIRGQGYDSASNMQGEFSGLKIDVLEIIKEDGSNADQRAEANGLLHLLEDFDFAFTLHLMKNVLGISNELSQALQRKDQDIINAMNLGRSRCRGKAQAITTEHYYRVELFYTVVDIQLQELNDRFTETNTQLLLCIDCLNPTNLFSTFDKARLIEFAKFYPSEFSAINLVMLDNQLETYIIDMRSNVEFSSLKGIKNLSEKLVETGRHIVYPLVYLLLKLAMILPVATSTMERVFSAMKIVKNRLRNRLRDAWMNDCLVTYIEKDVFNKIGNELIIQQFQNMKSRRGQL
ncbi:Zinc finger MYM-type protein 1 [Glycine soja]